jgi:hypothetical protein
VSEARIILPWGAEQIQALANLIDAAVRANGIPAAKIALPLINDLETAMKQLAEKVDPQRSS